LHGCKSENNETPQVLLDIKEPLTSPYKIPADNPMKAEAVELGRFLFYDKRLSSDNTIACATCHQSDKAFTDGKSFSTGFLNRHTDRSSMSLVNLLWVNKFFWDGRSGSLEDQVHFPLMNEKEMNLAIEEVAVKLQQIDIYPAKFKAAFGTETITPQNIAKAIAQFERTIISNNSRFDKSQRGEITLTEQEERGRKLFFQHPFPDQNIRGGNCGDCHSGPLTTSTNDKFANNGLDMEPTDKGLEGITNSIYDRGKMRTPTLRNIELTAPYMHDGRFKTLEEVLDHYNDHMNYSIYTDVLIKEASNEVGGTTLKLTEQEKKDIIAFLKTLTDNELIQNTRFSNPFGK
jgi:cytochrome c peroxidase